MIYQLTSVNSNSNNFYGVEADLTLEDFQHACAYVQIVRDGLPVLSSCLDDCVGDWDGVILLNRFYGFKPIYKMIKPDEIIDFYDNWHEYVLKNDVNKINQFAVINASRKIVEFFCEKIEKTIQDFPHFEIELKRLRLLLNGECVEETWNWQRIDAKYLTGFKLWDSTEPELITGVY
ncbi:hypothetical protein [Arsenophonus nasoniae]|uniref:Uncharacterized protein n=1 Tax=Arsenophonus nasoniae TaxID=638 RepID=A0AA95GQM6_9GAMM|nr:hypothetical protein [Arsenophonus nasoniae]WGM03513.1 hypothetical protein QE210_18495 [Arsenophonus nasoniae]